MEDKIKELKKYVEENPSFLKKLCVEDIGQTMERIETAINIPNGSHFKIMFKEKVFPNILEDIRRIFADYDEDKNINLELVRELFLDGHANYYFVFSTERLLVDEKIQKICQQIFELVDALITVDISDGHKKLRHFELTKTGDIDKKAFLK